MASPSPEVLSTSKPSPEPILRLRKCLIRPYVEGDAEGAAQQADNPAIARWMRDSFPQPYTIEDSRRWVSTAMSSSPTRDFVICRLDGTTVVGSIGVKPRGDIDYRTMGLGYWVGEDHWGRGIATEAVSAFCDWAFEHFDKVLRLEAEVFEGNVASTRVLEKAGFVLESVKRNAAEKAGVVINVLMYCKLRQEV